MQAVGSYTPCRFTKLKGDLAPSGPAAARLLKLWVRIPREHVCLLCCVLSGKGLGDEAIARSEESYRLWCVAVCDLETS